jgi:hypothetical protein
MEEILDGDTDRLEENFTRTAITGEKYFGEECLACAYGRVYYSP